MGQAIDTVIQKVIESQTWGISPFETIFSSASSNLSIILKSEPPLIISFSRHLSKIFSIFLSVPGEISRAVRAESSKSWGDHFHLLFEVLETKSSIFL
jgi:hypothetical protein